jgi:hypothetical protein
MSVRSSDLKVDPASPDVFPKRSLAEFRCTIKPDIANLRVALKLDLSLGTTVELVGIRLFAHQANKPKIRRIIQDTEKMCMTLRSESRERAASINMKEFANSRGPKTIITIRALRTFTEEARNTV